MASYAVVQTGGKQYQVSSGDVIDVEKLEAEVGSRVELVDVRLVSEDSGVSVGTPTVDGAKVMAEVEDQFRGPKIIVFKYKAKTRYRKKNGHRQSYTRLLIQDILTGGAEAPPLEKKAAPARRTRTRKATEPEATVEAPGAPVAVETAPEEKPAPARRTRTRRVAEPEATVEAATTTETAAPEEKPAPARRRRTRAATAETTTEEKPATPRRTRSRAATTETAAEETPATARRRRTRTAASAEAPAEEAPTESVETSPEAKSPRKRPQRTKSSRTKGQPS